MAKRTLLVTGGAGFIGSNFIRYALREHTDWSLINLDKLTYAGNLSNLREIENHPHYRFIQGDIADRTLLDELFQREEFDAVINFAAESHVDRSILDSTPFIHTNIYGVQALLETARCHWIEKNLLKPGKLHARLVQVSTDEVYGTLGEAGHFAEDAPLQPNSPYAASKASADLLCRSYFKTYGLPVIVTRCSNNYGPYQFPEKLIPLATYRALHNEPIPVYGTGRNIRDWLHVEDHCRAIDLVLQKGYAGEVYNIGGNCEKRNIEIVEFILTELKKSRSLIQFVTDRPGHDWRYAIDATKMQSALGWQPKYGFETGLRETIRWYRGNEDWVKRVTSGEYKNYVAQVYEHMR